LIIAVMGGHHVKHLNSVQHDHHSLQWLKQFVSEAVGLIYVNPVCSTFMRHPVCSWYLSF